MDNEGFHGRLTPSHHQSADSTEGDKDILAKGRPDSDHEAEADDAADSPHVTVTLGQLSFVLTLTPIGVACTVACPNESGGHVISLSPRLERRPALHADLKDKSGAVKREKASK